MVFEYSNAGRTWVLHSKFVNLRNTEGRTFYFFCSKGKTPNSGEPCDLPPGKVVGVNQKTLMPFLKNQPTAADTAQ